MIQAGNIVKSFGERKVLNGIDLQIPRGCIWGLLGPSGAGKTTLIKILTGQLAADRGEIRILNVDVREFAAKDRQQIGIMMDQFGVYERFTCYENLGIFASLYQIPKTKIMGILEDVGLQEAAKVPAAKLSKGMRSRLQLARVLMQNPAIMFLDEPTGGLDPGTTEQIHNLILAKRREGCTIFLTTHDMVEAEKLCDEVALLNDGKIVEHGIPKEICRKYNHQKKISVHLYGGRDVELPNSKEYAKTLYQMMRDEQIETIHSAEPDLETVFMELTGKALNV